MKFFRESALIAGVFLVTASFPVGVPVLGEATHFADVTSGSEFESAITYGQDAGLITGYEDNTFRPDQNVTRAEALKLILVANDIEVEHADLESFSDVESSSWFAAYVDTAKREGWVQGYDDGTFRPNERVNRAEALKILANVSHTKLEENSEIWYQPYLSWGLEHFLVWVDSTGNQQPEKLMTRGEMAEMLYRFKTGAIASAPEYGIASYYGYSMNGVRTASGKNLDAYGFMTAHKTLPFGTRLKVTNTDTQQSVIVEVVDRGPYGPNRVVDLTPAAFEAIGSLSSGLLRVRVEVLK